MSNKQIFNLAKNLIPGGVNSPVRSFNLVGGNPFFTSYAKDCYLFDIENKRYIDYVSSWGANIVGHANEYVVQKTTDALKKGFSYGTPTELEVALAKKVTSLLPSIEKLRLVNSGTEAGMSVIRLARGYTGRDCIIKFEGCYHGHSDSLLVKSGSGLATFGTLSSSGVPPKHIEDTRVLQYNNIAQLENIFASQGEKIAAVILEPFAGNMNFVRPSREFIATISRLCNQYKSLLIFDEVMTGFRVAMGSAQQVLQVKPDLTMLGKVVGGGMPLAAFGGRAEIMDYLSPIGPVYQAGTLSGNPIAVTAGLATLELIQQDNFYQELSTNTSYLVNSLKQAAVDAQIEMCTDSIGGMFGFYFMNKIPSSFEEIQLANINKFNVFFNKMLLGGVFFAPSMYEAGFTCIKHTKDIIDETLEIACKVFKQM